MQLSSFTCSRESLCSSHTFFKETFGKIKTNSNEFHCLHTAQHFVYCPIQASVRWPQAYSQVLKSVAFWCKTSQNIPFYIVHSIKMNLVMAENSTPNMWTLDGGHTVVSKMFDGVEQFYFKFKLTCFVAITGLDFKLWCTFCSCTHQGETNVTKHIGREMHAVIYHLKKSVSCICTKQCWKVWCR